MMATGDYYDAKLSAERLRRCYDLAPPRVQQYLAAEIDHVLTFVRPGDRVLELGCGFGRVLRCLDACQSSRRILRGLSCRRLSAVEPLALAVGTAGQVVGIDTSKASLQLASELLKRFPNCQLLRMDAQRLELDSKSFDLVVCIQNGLSAFHADPRQVLEEAVRVVRPGGLALFSTYTERFWEHRLEWFELQAAAGLLGEIDRIRTGEGTIVCKDGFNATTISPDRFEELDLGLAAEVTLRGVDGSGPLEDARAQ